MSPLHSRGTSDKRGRDQIWLPHHWLLRGQEEGGNACHPCILGDPLTKEDEIRLGCLTLGFSRVQKRAEMLRHLCILGDPQTRGGGKFRSGCLTLAFSGAQKRAEMPWAPCVLRHPQRKCDKIGSGCLNSAFWRKCYITPAFSGILGQRGAKIRSGCLTLACSGGRKRVEMLHPPFSSVPKYAGTKLEVAASAMPSGGKATSPLHSRGSPNKEGQNQKWLPHHCLLGGPREGGNALSPCILGDPQRQPQGQYHKWLPHPCLLRGPKEGGSAMSPLHSRGSRDKRGQNENWLPQHRLLGGPKEGGNAMPPLYSLGSPNIGGQSEVAASPLPSRGPKRGRKCYVTPVFSGVPKYRGTQSNVAASPLPSRGPKRGRTRYVSLAFLGTPNAKHGDKIRSGPQVGTSPTGMHFQ